MLLPLQYYGTHIVRKVRNSFLCVDFPKINVDKTRYYGAICNSQDRNESITWNPRIV